MHPWIEIAIVLLITCYIIFLERPHSKTKHNTPPTETPYLRQQRILEQARRELEGAKLEVWRAERKHQMLQDGWEIEDDQNLISPPHLREFDGSSLTPGEVEHGTRFISCNGFRVAKMGGMRMRIVDLPGGGFTFVLERVR